MNGRTSPRLEELTEDDKKARRIVVPKMLQNGDVEGDGRLKIHRIPLCRTARCFVSHVTSPSCIWVKPINHITEKLQTRDLNTLTAAPVAHKDRYVMAPLEEGVYGRARIQEINQRTKFVKVLFIDEGTSAWMNPACLAKMDEMLAFHPWQAIAVALFKVKPHQSTMADNWQLKWSREDTATLRAILKKFELVRVEAVLSTVYSNNYNDYVKVNMYGMESESDEMGTSIAHLFARERYGEVDFERHLFDGFSQKLYDSVTEKEDIPTAETLETWRMIFPKTAEVEENLAQFDIVDWWEVAQGPQIQIVDVEWLNKKGYCHNGEYLVNVEGRSTISPYEFYARPLKMKRMEDESAQGDTSGEVESRRALDDEEDAMIVANDELANFAEELNTFYGHPRNRKPINSARVSASLEKEEHVYGIVEVDDEYAQFTGCWQRVEILGLKDGYHPESFFCRIRFLDSGGTDVRLLSSILEIHPMHCVRPPFCLQMCLHGLKPADRSDWSDEARRFFFRELREDVPVSLNILGLNKRPVKCSYSYSCQAFQRPNVLFVNIIQVRDGSMTTTLDVRLQQEKHAVFAPNSPVQLID